jgi:uncharacterized protein YpmB
MRVERYKRPPLMSPAKWSLLAAVCLIAVLIGLNQFYRYIQSPVWAEEREAEAEAVQTAGLKSAVDSHKFVWDETVWVVEGKDRNDEDVYVWLTEGGPLTINAKDGLTKEQMKERFLADKPDANVSHMTIGMVGGEPVWEIFYTRKEASITYSYYDFYRFRDGTFIVTYKLPNR